MEMCRAGGKRIGEKGLTLLELAVVLALLGIAGMIAYPRLHHMAINYNLRSAAREIAADFAQLKERAMSENATYMIIFSEEDQSNNYILRRDGGPVLQTKSPTEFGRDIRITQARFGNGTTVRFRPRGVLQPMGTLILANSLGSTVTITAISSGRTNVQFNMR